MEVSNNLKKKIFQFLYEESIKLDNLSPEDPFYAYTDRVCAGFMDFFKTEDQAAKFDHDLFNYDEYVNFQPSTDEPQDMFFLRKHVLKLNDLSTMSQTRLDDILHANMSFEKKLDNFLVNQRLLIRNSLMNLVGNDTVLGQEMAQLAHTPNGANNLQPNSQSQNLHIEQSNEPDSAPASPVTKASDGKSRDVNYDTINELLEQRHVPDSEHDATPPTPIVEETMEDDNSEKELSSSRSSVSGSSGASPRKTGKSDGNHNPIVNRILAKLAAYQNSADTSVKQEGSNDSSTPKYRMSRTIQTIPELHKEWYFGLNGHPSINELNQKYQNRWRSNPTEKNYYISRAKIIKYLHKLQDDKGLSETDAIVELEDFRIKKKFYLTGLSKHITVNKLLL